jgi:hypothetical protein
MRQVDQRVSVRCNLEALTREAVAGYIAHRLAVAGGRSDRIAFAPDAVELIFQTSKGVPRLINLICDRALHRGHLARTEKIDIDILRVAVVDLGLADVRVPLPPAFPARGLDVTRTSGGEDRPKPEDVSEHVSFDDHDLLHAVAEISSKLQDTRVVSKSTPTLRREEPLGQYVKEDDAAVSAAGGERPLKLLVESWGRRWTRELLSPRLRSGGQARRLAVALSVLLVAAAAFVAVSYWQTQEGDLNAPIRLPPLPQIPVIAAGVPWRPRPQPNAVPLNNALPAAPATGATALKPAAGLSAGRGGAGLYAIDVALFNSRSRADRLAGELTAAGFHAYQNDLDLGGRGHLHEVLVGMYATREAADAAAAKIREMRGYQDAKVVAGR